MRYTVNLAPLVILFVLTACFRSGAPAPVLEETSAGDALQFAIIGDYGTDTSGEADVAALVDSWDVDFVATVGDNNYFNGEASTIDRNIGKYYGQFIKPYRGSYGPGSPDINRFWPALGNHDWYSLSCSGDVCSGPYFDYFDLPNNERYYDVVIGPVHLFVLDSYSEEPDGVTSDSVQANWLRGKLAASTAPHKLVLLHHAPYSSSSRHGSDPTYQWPFEAWGATAVVAGHDHHYERLQVGGIPYFVNGAGGRPLYGLGNPLPETQVAYDEDLGAMLVSVEGAQIRYQFFSRTGTLIDSFTQGGTEAFLSRQVSSGNDDAEENTSGAVYLTSSDLELVSDTGLGNIGQTVGMRFQDISVPRGATILEAYLEFTVDEPSPDPTSLTFVGEAADNAAPYNSATFDISSRPATTARMSWNEVAAWTTVGSKHKTPDLAPVVQEIVNRNGWQSGNALALVVTGSGRRTAESYNGSPGSAPRLVVRYGNGAPANLAPSLSRPGDRANFVGDSVSLQLVANDPEGDPLSFSASGLPAGLSLNSSSGLISGRPNRAGAFSVSVSVSDGAANATTSFDWRIDEAQIQTFSAQVAFREDDAEEYLGDGSVRLNSTDLELAVERQAQAVGIRFRNVSVPPGSVITRAYLTFEVDEAGSGPTDLSIRGEAADSAAAYSNTRRAITGRPLTNSGRSWTDLPAWSLGQVHRSPDVSAVVQEIIDRPGWRAGNALAFVVTGSGKRTAESYDGSRSKAARLTLEYRPGGGTRSVDVRVATGKDDAEQRSDGSIYRYSTDLELTQDGGTQTVGLRFTDVAIPEGARITNAYVQFKVDESSSEATQLTLRAQAADSAEPFEYVDNSISARPRSSAAVSWSPAAWHTVGEAGSAQRTPNLASLIQEVVDRPGWHPGNALGLIVTGTGRRVAESANGDAAGAPLLHVDFE